MAEKKVSVRLAVEADRLDETKRKLEELGVTIKNVGNDNSPDKLRRQFEALEGRLDPVSRATQRLARDQATLNSALASGAVSQQRYTELMNASQQAHDRMIAGQAAATASTGQFKGALGNLGLQLQDVTVQAQMGTSAFIILAQQGPQIASAFGPAGIAIGTVVAIASVAAGVLFTLGDETKKSAKEIDTFGDVLGIFEGRARESGAAIDTLTDSYRALGGELRALSKLALQADIATLTEKRAKDQKSAWDAIRNATMSGAQDVPAALGALQQLGQDKDIAAFLGKLQTLNEKGAIKLMRDEDIRALLETGEALRVAEARMADLEGRATPAQKALLGYADAAREAARATREAADAAYEASRAQGLALGSVIVQERDLDRKIAALKGGEAAMKAYGEEQIRATTYDKAFKSNLAAGESLLDARTEATRIATKAVEAYRLEQQRADDQKANTKAESQAERDAKAYAKVSEELDRGIAEQQRLAGAVGQSVEAQREANTQTKIAEALSKAHTTASTAEGKALEEKVRKQERWRAAAADAAVLDSSKRQLAYAQQELSLMGQAEPVRARALQSFQIQQEAQEKLKSTTPELVAQWVQYQEAIADTQAIKAFQLEIQGAAKEMSRDITQTLLDREAKWSDLGKTIGKRIALGLIEANIVLPITTAVVGAMPGLFGIQSPANQNAANQNGAGGVGGTGSLLSNGVSLVSAGQSIYNGSNMIGSAANWFATSHAGTALGLSAAGTGTAIGAGTGVAAGTGAGIAGAGANAAGVMGVYSSPAVTGLTSTGAATTSAASTLGAAAPYGALGGIAGSFIGNSAGGNKAIGAASGAAVGAGSAALGSYLATGAMMGPWGLVAAAVIAAVMAAVGTQKPTVGPNAAAALQVKNGQLVRIAADADNGANTDSVIRVTDSLAAAYNAMTQLGAKLPDGAPVYRYIEGGDKVSIHGEGATNIGELVQRLTASLSAEGLVGRALGTDVVKSSTDPVQVAKYLALAKTIEDATSALDGLDKSLGAVQKAAFKATGEALLPMVDELKTAREMGMGSEYINLVSGQVSNLLDNIANPRTYTETQTAVATLTGQISAWKSVLEKVNPELSKAVDAIQKAGLERIYQGVRTTYDASLNEAKGLGYRNNLQGVRDYWNAHATDMVLAGRDPNALYAAQARAIIDGLDNSQIDDVVSYFRDLDPVMASLADSLRGTTTAAKEAQKAVQANADSLTAWLNGQALGDASSLSPWEKMLEAQRQFDTAISASRQNGDIAGATKAADALLSASRPALVLGTEAYSQREDWITSTLRNLGHELGLPGFKTGGSFEVGGWGGVDSTLVRFMATPGERVTVTRPDQHAQGQTVVVRDNQDVVRALSQLVNVLSAKLDAVTAELASLKSERRKGDNLKLAGAA